LRVANRGAETRHDLYCRRTLGLAHVRCRPSDSVS
jgi:hypothetical protein